MAKTTRYFAAMLDGKIFFRQSPTRAYVGVIRSKHTGIGFTTTPGFDAPAVEISKPVFTGLLAIKNARLIERDGSLRYAVPRDSWVKATSETTALLVVAHEATPAS